MFNAIEIPRNLANIPIEKIEKEIYGNSDNNYHHSVTGLTLKQNEANDQPTIKEDVNE